MVLQTLLPISPLHSLILDSQAYRWARLHVGTIRDARRRQGGYLHLGTYLLLPVLFSVNCDLPFAFSPSCAYIATQDWWLTPELYLRRPPAYHPEWRLDRLLKRKAEQGVKIHVVVYKEVCPQSFSPVSP
jgi:hypothetical protein